MKVKVRILMLLFLFTGGLINTSVCQKPSKDKIVNIQTIYGSIEVALFNETPLHRDNFINLAKSGALNGSIFHRVINGFMIQGGGTPGSNGSGSIGKTIPAEIVPLRYHKKGALAAARMGDRENPKRESSGSQFYIVHGRKYSSSDLDNLCKRTKVAYTEEQKSIYKTDGGAPHLDGAYTVFGQVVSGMEIVDKIASTPVNGEKPLESISFELKIIN
jgi:cyclophilin family peptidyl-prolyl cis-trans isomerase